MFFYIGNKSPFSSLNQVHERLWIDDGWYPAQIHNRKIWYKGYSTECRLKDNISNILDGYKPAGKWIVITDKYEIYHPVLRGFPVYEHEDSLTTFWLPDYTMKLYDNEQPVNNSPIIFDDAASGITDCLLENIENFFRYNELSERINMIFSAGLDTLTVWTALNHVTKDYNLFINPKIYKNVGTIDYETDLFPFLKSHFGYEVNNFYKKLNWHITGFYGERTLLREVDTAHIVANHLGVKVIDVLTENDYLYHFMRRPSSLINNHPTYKSELMVKKACYNKIFYDNQMWHLDNNFTFSPLQDIRMSKIVYRMSINDIVENQKNGTIQRKIIEKLNPDMLSILARYKNYGDMWKGFNNNFSKLEHNFRNNLVKNKGE